MKKTARALTGDIIDCMLARKWEGQDPTGWLMSEKLDGVRLIRPAGPEQGYVYTRSGTWVAAPKWWLNHLFSTDTFMDGEAWMGRRQFEEVRTIIQSRDAGDEWSKVKFCIIEPILPEAGSAVWSGKTEDPLVKVSDDLDHPIVFAIRQYVCQGRADLDNFYQTVLAAGGEGVVLRHPQQAYHCGRSPYLLKVKPEIKGNAVVAAYKTEAGRLISLQCLTMDSASRSSDGSVANTRVFLISNGLTEATRANPPAIGSTVKFLYQSLTPNGVPRFAKLMLC